MVNENSASHSSEDADAELRQWQASARRWQEIHRTKMGVDEPERLTRCPYTGRPLDMRAYRPES